MELQKHGPTYSSPTSYRRPSVATLVTAALAAALVLHTPSASAHGTLTVDSVIPESPAAKAGIEAGDRLLRIAGQDLESYEELEKVMDAHRPGDTVPLVVQRAGETIELELEFGARPEGGVSIGVRLAVGMGPAGERAASHPPSEPDAGAAECFAWIEKTYRIDSLATDLNLDLSDDYEAIRSCVERDSRLMGRERAVKHCDNIFKVHCSGVDLLAEIGEAQVERCEAQLSKSSGLDPQKDEAWRTCARHEVFDRYAVQGEPVDEAACKAAWVECREKSAGEGSAWLQWGGPNGDFRAPAALATSWPESGPRRLWTRALGEGYSAILVEAGRLYTMYRTDGEEAVVCLDAGTGETVWEHRYEHGPHERHVWQFGDGPSSTPVIDGEMLFTVGVAGKMHGLKKKDGAVVWSRNLWDEDLGGNFLPHGYSSSPVAHGGKVIVPVGGAGAGLVAFDQKTGRVEWKTLNFRNSYSSPRLANVAGEDEIVVFMAEELIGVDPASGELRWRYPHANQWKHNVNVPAVDGDVIFLSSPQAGARGLRLVRDGETIRVEEVWSTRRVQFYHVSSVRIGDWVYGSTGTGLAFMTAINVRTGEVGWRERGFAKANCVEAGGKLVILDEDGVLYLASATPEKLVVHAETQLLDRTAWTVPTIVGTTLYVRDRQEILAVDLG